MDSEPIVRALRAGGFAGEIVGRRDPDYDAARVVWNGMIDRHPAAVARPTGVGDVVTAVRAGRERALSIAVRSGGHSIPGFSTCDDGLVIDLSRMAGVRVDAIARTARVNGGALLGELDRAAQAVGLVCPVGVVSHTGVAGLTLGGGMGRLQRRFGLTIDSLTAVELVTADGRRVRASEDENADLFWGLRGAGANFGIATAFEFRLHPLDGPVAHGAFTYPLEHVHEVAALVREAAEAGSDELWVGFGLGRQPGGDVVAGASVLHLGSPEEAERDLAPLRAVGPPREDTVEAKTYLAVQQLADEAMAWGGRFSMTSAFLASLPDELVSWCADHTATAPPDADCGFSVWPCGRAIARVPEDATAFTGRSAAYWIGGEALWRDPELDDACRAWAREAMVGVQPYTTAGLYVNDVAEVADGVARSVYGDVSYERLVALKRAWDPDNVFRLNQNIRP